MFSICAYLIISDHLYYQWRYMRSEKNSNMLHSINLGPIKQPFEKLEEHLYDILICGFHLTLNISNANKTNPAKWLNITIVTLNMISIRWYRHSMCSHERITSQSYPAENLPCLAMSQWGRVMHICISKLIVIGSDNGLSTGRHQAII